MKLIPYKAPATSVTVDLKPLQDDIKSLQQATGAIAGLNGTVNNLSKAVTDARKQVEAVTLVADLPAQPLPLQLASVVETGLRYEWRSGGYVAGAGGGRVEKTDGAWTPIKATANPAWIKSTGYDARYERTLKGEPITRVQFEVCQFTDRTKTLAIDVTDFVTGCSVSGYWGIMGRFFDQLVIDRTLRLFVGVDTATGRVILMVLDNAIAGSDKYCWLRNVKLNGYPADLVAVDDLARSAYPKN